MNNRIEVQRICEYCFNEFKAKTTVTKYCSHKCNQRDYKLRKRNEKVNKSQSELVNHNQQLNVLLKSREFLTVKEVAQLLNCSIRSVYYYIKEGNINAVNLGQRLTRIKRSEIDKLFEIKDKKTERIKKKKPAKFKIEDCYNLSEVQKKFGVSEKGLAQIINRNKIPKYKKGWYAYVPKELIDKLFK